MQIPVTTFLKVAWGHVIIPVAMAPLAQSKADDIAAWTLRSSMHIVFGQGNNSSIGATVEKRGLSKNSMPL